MALTPKERQEAIDSLTTNCSCWGHEGDREVLNNLSDEKIEQLVEGMEELTSNASIAQLITNGIEADDGFAYRIDPETGAFQKARLTGNCNENMEEEEEYEEEEVPAPKKGKKPVTNREKPMTEQEWWATAPPSLKKHHQRLVANENRERANLIERLTANTLDEEARERLVAIYNKHSTEDLQELAASLPGGRSIEDELPDYSGMVGQYAPVTNRNRDLENDLLVLPTETDVYNTGVVSNRRDERNVG